AVVEAEPAVVDQSHAAVRRTDYSKAEYVGDHQNKGSAPATPQQSMPPPTTLSPTPASATARTVHHGLGQSTSQIDPLEDAFRRLFIPSTSKNSLEQLHGKTSSSSKGAPLVPAGSPPQNFHPPSAPWLATEHLDASSSTNKQVPQVQGKSSMQQARQPYFFYQQPEASCSTMPILSSRQSSPRGLGMEISVAGASKKSSVGDGVLLEDLTRSRTATKNSEMTAASVTTTLNTRSRTDTKNSDMTAASGNVAASVNKMRANRGKGKQFAWDFFEKARSLGDTKRSSTKTTDEG
ncbi:unnamed protein product, partial [Amoebophrya sp. A25]